MYHVSNFKHFFHVLISLHLFQALKSGADTAFINFMTKSSEAYINFIFDEIPPPVMLEQYH